MNRSVPVDTILPHVHYPDVSEAVSWLARVFGFTEHFRYGEPLSGAQICLGKAYVMVHLADGQPTPAQLGFGTQFLTIFVDDVDSHFARSKAAGAKIVEDLHETVYGERQYGAEDLAGHRWLFSQHSRDVNPEEWGAQMMTPRAE